MGLTASTAVSAVIVATQMGVTLSQVTAAALLAGQVNWNAIASLILQPHPLNRLVWLT